MVDVVIIGGGISGTFAGYFLAKRGVDVQIFDAFDQPAAASRMNPGGINPLHGPEIPGKMQEFALSAYRAHLDEWEDLSEKSTIDFRGRTIDRVFAAFSDEESDNVRSMQALYEGADGFEARWMAADEAKRFDSRFSDDIHGGLMTSGNATVDPGAYLDALRAAATSYGAEFVDGNISSIRREGERLVEIKSGNASVVAGNVIFTTGAWMDQFTASLGVRIPVAPLRGQMLVCRFPESAPRHDITWQYNGIYHFSDQIFWLGGTMEQAGFEADPTEEGRELVLERTSRILPSIREVDVLEHIVGFRPSTPDKLPVLGQVPGLDNAYIANGGGSKGILLSAAMGRNLASLIVDGKPEDDIRFADPSRFLDDC